MAQIGHNPPLGGHDGDDAVLVAGLRTRAETATRLAEMLGIPEAELRERLHRLDEAGFLRFERGNISYREPDAVLADRAAGILSEASATLDARIAEAGALVAAIPALMDSWAVGSAVHLDFRVDVFHGPHATTDLWLAHAARGPIRRTDGILPDARRALEDADGLIARWNDAIRSDGLQVRALLSAADVALPATQEILARSIAPGVEVRVLESPPSWFWITDNAVGLPLNWGESWPTSAVVIRNETIVGLVKWLYERLWADGVPLAADGENNWDSLLALMAQGATLEAASDALGISSRTGRRRVSAAMDYFGVDGMLALGAAWQKSR